MPREAECEAGRLKAHERLWTARGGGPLSVPLTSAPEHIEGRCRRKEACSPTQDDAVVKEVHFNVLEADGLVEALWDQEPQQAAEVRGVEKGDPDLLREPLQQRQQHRARILPT